VRHKKQTIPKSRASRKSRLPASLFKSHHIRDMRSSRTSSHFSIGRDRRSWEAHPAQGDRDSRAVDQVDEGIKQGFLRKDHEVVVTGREVEPLGKQERAKFYATSVRKPQEQISNSERVGFTTMVGAGTDKDARSKNRRI